jgi:hypothetical protein
MIKESLKKSELIDLIQAERTQLEVLISQFSDDQLIKDTLKNGWSIKDLMTHIAAWERVGYDIVHAAWYKKPLKPYVPKVFESIDDFNMETLEKNKDIALIDIKNEFKIAHRKFFDLIRNLDVGFIESNLPFEGTEEITIQFIISTNTHQHYRDHSEELKRRMNAS